MELYHSFPLTLQIWNDILIQWYTFDVFKKLNSREVIFYMLATAEFTFLHITSQIKVHHTINSVSESMKFSGVSSVC